jgi:hypothetical protein
VSIFIESEIEFDFTRSSLAVKHDAANTIFPGVDFIIEEPHRWIWVEVKNWEGASVPAARRGGQRRSFLSKLRSNVFYTDTLRAKFTGTTTYLVLTGNHPKKEVLYIALLESPKMESALMGHASRKLSQLIKRDSLWQITVNAAVMDLAEWNARFPEYPARSVN